MKSEYRLVERGELYCIEARHAETDNASDYEWGLIAECGSFLYARLIVAALNATDGISVEALEAGYVAALEKSHAVLLDHVTSAYDFTDEDPEDGTTHGVVIEARRVQAMRGET